MWKLPLDDVYRQLSNPAMSLRSYAKLYRNDGAMTPGITEETVIYFSLVMKLAVKPCAFHNTLDISTRYPHGVS